MTRHPANGVPASVVAILVLMFAAGACSPSGSPAPAATGGPTPGGSPGSEASSSPLGTRTLPAANASETAVALAAAIVDAPDIGTAYTATADALARAGIKIETTTHVYVEPVAPAAATSIWPRQVLAAAIEAQNRRFVDRISASDAGVILAAMGWPGAEVGASGDGWLTFVRAWLTDAHASPDDPTSFAPLFVAEMIRLGDGVDLATAPAGDVHFGLLELLVLFAGFERSGAATAQVELAAAHPAPNGEPRTAAAGPCDAVMDRYGIPPDVGQPVDAPSWMQKGVVKLLGLSGSAAKALLKAVRAFQKVWRAAAFYFYAFVRVETIDKRIHKPNEDNPVLFTTFTAKAGVDPEAFKGWVKDNGGPNGVRELNDDTRCAESLGVPTMASVGDVAEDAKKWIVDWESVAGTPEHAEFAEPCGSAPTSTCNTYDRHQPAFGMKLRNVAGGSVAQADLYVRIKEEKKKDHIAPGAVEREAPLTIRASVDSSSMPSISPLNLTNPGGLVGPGLETIAGLVQSSFKPSSKATIIVTFHEPVQLITASPIGGPSSWHGKRCEADDPEWLIRGDITYAQVTETFLYRALIDPTTMMGTYTYEAIGTVPGGVSTKNGSGRATIAGQADGSVILFLDAISVKSTLTAAGTTYSVTLPIPAVDFTWKPAPADACP